MPYEAETLIENSVILISVSGIVTLDEVEVGTNRVQSLLSLGDAPTHLIIDVSRLKEFPLNILALLEIIPKRRPPGLGCVVLVGMHSFLLNKVTHEVGQLVGFEFTGATSVEKALEYLLKRENVAKEETVSLSGD